MIDIEDTVEQRLYNLQLQQLYEMRKLNHPNPLVRFGSKVFSQSDEDGITLEICKRLKIDKGTFIEFGVANGMENNTLALLACGWKGEWFGGENLSFDATHSPRLNFSKEWITRFKTRVECSWTHWPVKDRTKAEYRAASIFRSWLKYF